MSKRYPEDSLREPHECWEKTFYSKGRHLNLYPYHAVVGFVLSHYGNVHDRSQIHIIELGCGAGNNMWFAAREGFSAAGIDGSESAIKYAKKRFKEDNLKGDFKVGNFAMLPWPDDNFDMVLDRGALTTTTKDVIEKALHESERVLKPGGKLLSIIYSHEHPGRQYGVHIGNNDYDSFTGGYFLGMGTTHFVTREEIDILYGSLFHLESIEHIYEEDRLNNKPLNAFWKIACVKK